MAVLQSRLPVGFPVDAIAAWRLACLGGVVEIGAEAASAPSMGSKERFS
jgi:hypothetical protein